MNKRVLLIINPCAGKRKGELLKKHLGGWFAQNDMNCDIFATEKCYHAAELVEKHLVNHDIVACMGGDGTLNETINGLIASGCELPLGYIPAGSTNDFARSMNISMDTEQAIKDISKGHTRKIDIGKINDRYFSYIASFGAFTGTSYTTPQKRKNKLGHKAYLLEGTKEITRLHSHRVSIKADDQCFNGDYIFGAISNSLSVAGLFKLKESFVDFEDGMMELVLIKKPRNIGDLFQAVNCLRKQDYSKPCIQVCHAKHFEITCDGKMDWSVDGEHFFGENNFTIDCLNSRVELICSKN